MPSFPRSSKYALEWLKASMSGGANVLQLAEWLAEALELKPGMRVLDLACGRAGPAAQGRRLRPEPAPAT